MPVDDVNVQTRFGFVLFDCDGTLLNTIGDMAFAGNEVCRAHGWPTHDEESFKKMVGDGQRVLVQRFVPPHIAADPELLEVAYQEFRTMYSAHKEDSTGPYEGMADCLERLRQAGVSMGVLTNKNHEQAVPLVESFFPGMFDAVQGRVDELPAKPEVPMTRALMDSLGAEPARTLMVGDTSVDIACGVNVGIASCGVLWGFRDEEELRRAGADMLVKTPAELADFILGSGDCRCR